MKTVLNHIVLSEISDCKTFTLIDKSVYVTPPQVTSAQYRITIPNFNAYVDVAYTPNQAITINSNILKLSNTPFQEQLVCLPSGLYIIRQSICPNDKLFIEKKYFNICNELNSLSALACEALQDCKKDLSTIYKLYQNFYIAKDVIETCDECKGITLYNETLKELQSLTDTNCCN